MRTNSFPPHPKLHLDRPPFRLLLCPSYMVSLSVPPGVGLCPSLLQSLWSSCFLTWDHPSLNRGLCLCSEKLPACVSIQVRSFYLPGDSPSSFPRLPSPLASLFTSAQTNLESSHHPQFALNWLRARLMLL